MTLSLIIPAFFAGLLIFLAPCTFPLVPGYLAFISGVSMSDLQNRSNANVRRKVFLNGVFYCLGFSIIFIILGSLFGLGGQALVQYRILLTRIGGAFIIVFGLFLMNVLKLPLGLQGEYRLASHALRPGTHTSSFLFGAIFAFGWTPCIGPVLGSILLIASTTATVLEGMFLLSVFSLGLALPFLIVALFAGSAIQYIKVFARYMNIVSIVGGLLLVGIGILLVTDTFSFWTGYVFRFFDFLKYESLLRYL